MRFNLIVIATSEIKSNLSLYSLHYDEACNEFAGPISASLRPRNAASFEMLQRWQTVGITVSDLTGPRIKFPTSRSRDKHVTARLTRLLLAATQNGLMRLCNPFSLDAAGFVDCAHQWPSG